MRRLRTNIEIGVDADDYYRIKDSEKEMLLVDDVENREFLRELFEAMYPDLPAPKKKKK